MSSAEGSEVPATGGRRQHQPVDGDPPQDDRVAVDGPLTAATVAAMNETTLRRRVLIRLCEALGWQDVREGHGTTERGKDIVGWRLDAAGVPIGCAVVAKATPIDGRAEITNRSAGGVFNQVAQCFGTPYRDRRTGAEHPVGRCLVITNKAITQQAADAFWDMMRGTIHADKVELIDGQRLWALVQLHFPQALVGRVVDAREAAEAIDDSLYRIAFASDDAGLTFTVRERYTGAFAERPLTFEISDGPGGMEALAALQQVVEHDTPVNLSGEAARAIRLAKDVRHLNPIGEFNEVVLTPPEPHATHTVRLMIDDGQGAPLIIDQLVVDLLRIRDDCVRYTNRRQDAPPLRFRYDAIVAAGPDGTVALTGGVLHYDVGSANIDDRRTIARLVAIFQRPCTLRLIDRATREILLEAALPAIPLPAGYDAVVALVEALMLMQNHTGVPINIPDTLTEDDLNILKALAVIAHTGRLVGTWAACDLPLAVADASALAPLLAGDAMMVRYGETHSAQQVGDATIPLGPVVVTFPSARLADPAATRAQIDAGETTISLRLVPGDDPTVERRYLDWGPRDADPPPGEPKPLSTDAGGDGDAHDRS